MNDNCHVDPVQKTATPEERKTVKRVLLTVRGMGCSNCAMRVHNSLVALKGVTTAYVDHTTGTAEVSSTHTWWRFRRWSAQLHKPGMMDDTHTAPFHSSSRTTAGVDGEHVP